MAHNHSHYINNAWTSSRQISVFSYICSLILLLLFCVLFYVYNKVVFRNYFVYCLYWISLLLICLSIPSFINFLPSFVIIIFSKPWIFIKQSVLSSLYIILRWLFYNSLFFFFNGPTYPQVSLNSVFFNIFSNEKCPGLAHAGVDFLYDCMGLYASIWILSWRKPSLSRLMIWNWCSFGDPWISVLLPMEYLRRSLLNMTCGYDSSTWSFPLFSNPLK